MTKKQIVPGLGYLDRNDFYAEALRLVPDATQDTHIQIALSLSRARMKGEADGYSRAAADLDEMVHRLRSGAAILNGKNRGAA
jgi:hypothetical protein